MKSLFHRHLKSKKGFPKRKQLGLGRFKRAAWYERAKYSEIGRAIPADRQLRTSKESLRQSLEDVLGNFTVIDTYGRRDLHKSFQLFRSEA